MGSSVIVARNAMQFHIDGVQCLSGSIEDVKLTGPQGMQLPTERRVQDVTTTYSHAKALVDKVGKRVSILYRARAYWGVVTSVELLDGQPCPISLAADAPSPVRERLEELTRLCDRLDAETDWLNRANLATYMLSVDRWLGEALSTLQQDELRKITERNGG